VKTKLARLAVTGTRERQSPDWPLQANTKLARLALTVAALALAAMPGMARACDACMGGKDPTIRPAVNGAIFFMLGLVASMATGVGFFMRYLSTRARIPMAPHEELVQMMTMPERPNHV
jgi:hypothetical protein